MVFHNRRQFGGILRPFVAPAAGGVVLDAVSSTDTFQTGAGSTSYSGNGILTVGSGSNRALGILLNFEYAVLAPTGVTVTWNGVSMTQIITANGGNAVCTSQLWGLINPAAGNNTLAINWTNTCGIFIAGISFTGVDQTSVAVAFPHSTSSTSANNLSVTSAVGNYVICSQGSAPGGGSTTGTQIYYDSAHGTIINAAANYDVGAASVTIGNNNGACQPIVACDVLAG